MSLSNNAARWTSHYRYYSCWLTYALKIYLWTQFHKIISICSVWYDSLTRYRNSFNVQMLCPTVVCTIHQRLYNDQIHMQFKNITSDISSHAWSTENDQGIARVDKQNDVPINGSWLLMPFKHITTFKVIPILFQVFTV